MKSTPGDSNMSNVVVSPYSAEWPASFVTLREELLSVFRPTKAQVEHIGSTSVPGLVAKPVIDVLLGASALSDIESRIPAIEKLGYTYVAKYERELPMRRYFVRSGCSSLRVHLHAVVHGLAIWKEHIGLRDALRADPLLASQYADLKLRLAAEFAHDKSAYTDAKAPFIREVLSRLHSRADAD